MKLTPIKRWNMGEVHVYMSLDMCQDDGLRPLCSLDVFYAARLCLAATSERATSANFNKQSLPISKPLSQTNSMIKRHPWGEPRAFHSLCCCFTCLYFLLVRNGKNILQCHPHDSTSQNPQPYNVLIIKQSHIPGISIFYLGPSDLSPFHMPPIVHFVTQLFSSVSLNFPLILTHFPAWSLLGRKISICSGQCSYFLSSWGEFTCTLQDEWVESSRREMAVVKQYNPPPFLQIAEWTDSKNVNGRC